MRINLPMDLLRSFVTIVDTGPMARASEHVFVTQFAISLQMKRLADMIQTPVEGALFALMNFWNSARTSRRMSSASSPVDTTVSAP